MFHVQDNFIAGAPISQVPASWFNSVARFLNGLIGGKGVRFVKNVDAPSVIELIGDSPSAEVGDSPTDMKDTPKALDSNGGTSSWTAGGTDGLYLDCYCKIAPQTSGSTYTVFQRARLTISRDGLVLSVELLKQRIRIQAKNA